MAAGFWECAATNVRQAQVSRYTTDGGSTGREALYRRVGSAVAANRDDRIARWNVHGRRIYWRMLLVVQPS